MATIILVSEPDERGARQLLHAEGIVPAHLGDSHSASQLIERLGWAIDDGRGLESGDPRPLESPRTWPLPSGL